VSHLDATRNLNTVINFAVRSSSLPDIRHLQQSYTKAAAKIRAHILVFCATANVKSGRKVPGFQRTHCLHLQVRNKPSKKSGSYPISDAHTHTHTHTHSHTQTAEI
jgi:hypothetical protein